MQQRHCDELMRVGNELKRALENALATMDGASNWGLLDLLSGNYYMTFTKYHIIESAEANLAHVKDLARQFECELEAFDQSNPRTLDTTPFHTISHYFFDHLYVDFLIQGNITEAKEALKEMIRCTENILRTVNAQS
ncbi:hypothetical protein EEI45_04010 [Erysipelothrix piscisicarius]|uniref:Uncharacterized protein n=1 Tax=Erysipelothrix piscisicarius TaxID=2485784 RepID=A0A3S8RMB9_9FIRM|nr:hypothetical protein [Erysipelothrix piscisicarius]AZK44037.1 hypothetical protein EEI45_04010 [Erysipelothrix piscisicarius]